MKHFFNKHTLPFIILAFISSIAINGGIRILNVWLSPTEAVLRTLIFVITVGQGGVFVFFLLQWIAQVSTQKFTATTQLYILMGSVYIVAGFLGISLANTVSPTIKLWGYQDFLSENDFVLEAIKLYEEEQGHPPPDLEELYPTYLSPPRATLPSGKGDQSEAPELQLSIPFKSIDAESARRVSYDYEFLVGDDVNDQAQWELSIRIYLGSFQSVKFIYNQAQDYQSDYGRIGEWAYQGAVE